MKILMVIAIVLGVIAVGVTVFAVLNAEHDDKKEDEEG